jgi:hypothetical protein
VAMMAEEVEAKAKEVEEEVLTTARASQRSK